MAEARDEPADRGLCADRRPQHGGAGRARRRDRLVLPAALRRRRLLRGAARRRRQRHAGGWRPRATHATRRRYLPDTLVLETVHETADGAVEVVDFMPWSGTSGAHRPRAAGARPRRAGRDGDRDRAALRLRLGDPLGPAPRRAGCRDRRPRRGRHPHAGHAQGRELPQPRPLHASPRRDGAVRADLLPLARRRAGGDRPRGAARRDRRLVARVGRALQLRGAVARPGGALADHAEGADPRARPARSSRRRPPRCPRRSAARATGTIASAGCATRPSRSTRCRCRATRRGAGAGATGCCAPWPASPRRCSRSTASPASGGCRSSSCLARGLRGQPAGPDRQPRAHPGCSSTSTAR